MKLRFVDAGVLIAAVRGTAEVSQRAKEILEDPGQRFASSAFVRLEVLPKALYHQQEKETLFYEAFFRAVTAWAPIGGPLIDSALKLATEFGLSALDALHVGAAIAVGADELITTERQEKPIHRATRVLVRTINTR